MNGDWKKNGDWKNPENDAEGKPRRKLQSLADIPACMVKKIMHKTRSFARRGKRICHVPEYITVGTFKYWPTIGKVSDD